MKKVWIIMADQLSFKYLGYNGNKWIVTPNIDMLAGKGVVYTNAYCSSPLCIPSRFSFYTGRNTRHHKVLCDVNQLDKPTIFHYLGDRGVKSYAIGKLDFRFDHDQFHGITERPDSHLGAQDTIFGTNNFSSFLPECKVTTLDRDEDEQCERITEATLNCLRKDDHSLIFTGYVKPHESWDNGLWWDAPQKFWDLYNHREFFDTSSKGYAANVSLLDHHIGKCLKTASKEGLLDDTLVIFTSDHGEMAGEHNRWGKQCMYEEAIKVPFIMWHPKMPHMIRSEVMGLIDVFPTIFDYLGLEAPQCDGLSLLRKRPDDYHIFTEVFYGKYVDGRYCNWKHHPHTYDSGLKMLHRSIRMDQWKLVHNGVYHKLHDVDNLDDVTDVSKSHQKVFYDLIRLMEDRYPIRDIITRHHFERQSIFRKCF
jgi:choline-sulfatase